MTQKERDAEVRRRLYRYASYVKEIDRYQEDILHSSPKHDESGVRGTDISDPTGRMAVLLTEIPVDIEEKRQWVYAIDEALEEIAGMPDGELLLYLCRRVYGLDGRRHKKRKYRDMSYKIASEVNMSVANLYVKLGTACKVVTYYAIKRGLI